MRTWMGVMIAAVMVVVMVTASLAGAEGSSPQPAEEPSPVPAATGPATAAPQPQEIVAGGIVILRLRVTVGGMTPAQRTGALYERLNTIISDREVKPSQVKAVRKGNDWLVMAGPHLFVTVTTPEAKANKTTPERLAQIWASNLGKAIAAARPLAAETPPAAPAAVEP